MPMHVMVADDGRIIGYGPTLTKLLAEQSLIGRCLFEAFDLRRPSGLLTMGDLRAHEGEKLRLSLRGGARTMAFRGLAVSLGEGAGMVLNLSFGISVVDAVRDNALTDRDFAPTDLAIEMMYLVEAKTAAMAALRGLAQRLEDDKQLAQVQALTDTLTGLRNRRALSLALQALGRSQTGFALMHIDLDYFKSVNDTLGHAAGDHVLKVVAEILQRETREEDTVARVGGDEFVIAFPDMTEIARLESVARRIIAELSVPIAFDGQTCRISASIGIALSNHYEHPDPDRMQTDADEALYASKRAGRGQAQVYLPREDERHRA
jgi:diguanylate cyclase (GGDEF)-like protein